MVDDIPMVSYYRGKNVEDMTREELIEAVKFLGRQLLAAHKRTTETHEFYTEILKLRARR